MNRVLNISTFFKDAHSKGIICYSKEWLDFINKLDSAQLLELKIFFLCVTNKIKYKGGKKGYTLPQTQAKIRYVRVFPQDGIEQLLLVPNFPGFDEFMCQIHIGTVELSLDEITEFAKKLEAEAESDYEEIDSQVNINAKVVKNTSKEEKPE